MIGLKSRKISNSCHFYRNIWGLF